MISARPRPAPNSASISARILSVGDTRTGTGVVLPSRVGPLRSEPTPFSIYTVVWTRPVADHGNLGVLPLQVGDMAGLVLGQHVGDDYLDADRTGDGLGGAQLVAGEHHRADARGVQGLH